MKKKLVSIIIPIYNVDKYLRKCLDSVLNQTYENIEVILIDDGSQDKSSKICDEYAKKDKRIKVFHIPNGGVSHARNLGLENAAGEYIGFVDPDDYIENNMYEIMVNDLETNNTDMAIVGCITIYEDGSKIYNSKLKEKKTYNYEEVLKGILNENEFFGTLWNKLYKKEIFENERFDEKLKICEDLDVLVKVIPKCKKIVYNPIHLYYWLQRKNSVTNLSFDKMKKYWDLEIDVVKRILNEYKDKQQVLLKYAIKRYVRINVYCYEKAIIYNLEKIEIKKYKNEVLKFYDKCMNIKDINFKFKIKLFLLKYFSVIFVLFVKLKSKVN